MMYAVTAAEMRELDRITISEIGIPGAVLMETAGRRIADVVVEIEGPGRGPIAVVCGAGNNGGDGFVCARVLRELGYDASVYLAMPADKIKGDAALHLAAYRQVGGVVVPIDEPAKLDDQASEIETASLVVDALFGTGLARPIEGHLARVVEVINQNDSGIIAADIPSGLDADTGAVLGVAVRAHITVTMAFPKIGLVSEPGFASVGELRVVEIGIPSALAALHGVSVGVLSWADVADSRPAIGAADHKGTRGRLLVVAGSPGKRGAGRLAATAALRSGAGLVTLAGAAPAGTEIAAPDPVMSAILDTGASPAESIAALVGGTDAIAAGPGIPADDWGRELVFALLEAAEVPLVLDADALNHLAGSLDAVATYDPPVVLTPHPGEAARLLGTTAADVQRDRLAAARELATRSRAVCVLKGARTIVCDGRSPESFATIDRSGSPALATGGSGDVLTGIVGSLLAQKVPAAEAARLGVVVHGNAGSAAESSALLAGARAVIASDLIDHLGLAFDGA